MSTAASSTTGPPQAENEHTGRLEGAEGTTTSMDRRLGCWLICAGLIALASAAILVYERLQIYVDAGHTTVCDINGLLSCGTVMRTPQAEAFGFPNPFIGLVGFSIVVTIGAAILAGAQFKRWFWICLNIGLGAAAAFIMWLWFETTFHINAHDHHPLREDHGAQHLGWRHSRLAVGSRKRPRLVVVRDWPVADSDFWHHRDSFL